MTSFRARIRQCLTVAALAVLAGCAHNPQDIPGLKIDRSITAAGQDSRVRYLVVHYTSAGNKRALEVLSRGEVSAHYLISDQPGAPVYQLVDENRRAWHAGFSAWEKHTFLNESSIGIEIVNRGRTQAEDGTVHWQPYQPAQIEKLRRLLKALIARHAIKPSNVVGHSDISPQRKVDPGPLLPWRALAQDGIGRWFDEEQARQLTERYATEGLPDIRWFQDRLAAVGYEIVPSGVVDPATTNVLAAFQMHYRPARYDGVPDAETAAILTVLK